MLESIIKAQLDKIAKRLAIYPEYNLVIRPELPRDGQNRERLVIIKAGSPPCLILSQSYIEACAYGVVLDGRKLSHIDMRDLLERSLEMIPKMQKTLSLVPLQEAIALRRDSKKWKKALIPGYRVQLDDRYFKVSYQVTVKEILTNTSITRNGEDKEKIEDIIKKAKFDLSKIILENEGAEELVEMAHDISVSKLELPKASEISIIIAEGNEIKTKIEY